MKNYPHSFRVFLFAMLLLVTGGCSKETTDPEPGGDPYLALQEEVQPGPADGGEVSVLFATNRSWSVAPELPEGETGGWFTVAPRRGKAGERIAVKVHMEPNGESRTRRVTLVLRAASLVERIEVIQARKNAIIAGDSRRKIGSERQTLVVEVVGGAACDVTVKAGAAWIEEVTEAEADGNGAVEGNGRAPMQTQQVENEEYAGESLRTGTVVKAGTSVQTGARARMGTAATAGAWIGMAANAGAGAQMGSGANAGAGARAAGVATDAGAAGNPAGAGDGGKAMYGAVEGAAWNTEAGAAWSREATEAGAAGATRDAEVTQAGAAGVADAGAAGAAGAAWDAEAGAAGEVRRLRFAIAANPDAQERTGVIVFTDRVSGATDELTVVQAAWEDADPERTALRELYETTGGGGWTRSDNWCGDRPLAEWYGVETDAEGHVTALRLPENNLRGTIPQRIGALTHLRHLELPRNALEGQMTYYDEQAGRWHDVFEKLTELETIDLSHNALTGGMFMTLLKRLRRVDLSSNHLTGTAIPIQWAPQYENGRYIDVILNNNHLDDVQDFIVDHPQWSRIALQFIRQTVLSTGNTLIGGMRCENVYMPDFTYTDLRDGSQHSMQALYKNNKLTMLLQWDPTQEDSNIFMQTVVRRLHTLYGPQGFAMAAFVREGEAYRKAAEEYLRTHEVPWPVVAEYADAGGRRVILPAEPYPGLLLLDQDGKVVENLYNGMRTSGAFWASLEPDAKIDLVALSFEVSDGLNARFRNTFGDSEYVSTDYSQDKQYETLQKATRGKGIDLVLIGDAFTDIDIETGFYRQVMEFAMEAFFELEPTKSYREYFNVYSVNAVSRNAHIGDDRKMSALRTITDDSAAGLIDPSVGTIDNYLRVCPPPAHPYRFPSIIINGYPTGITYLRFGRQSYAFQSYLPYNSVRTKRTFQHETIGHLLGYLDDEYNNPEHVFIPEEEKQKLQQIQDMGYHLNVSLTSDPKAVPWAHLIGHPQFPRTGVYEGGHYYAKGVWRSELTSLMETSYTEGYFNAISRQLIVKEILELSGEGYTFEKFLAKDKDDYPTGSATERFRSEQGDYRHFPPVILD